MSKDFPRRSFLAVLFAFTLSFDTSVSLDAQERPDTQRAKVFFQEIQQALKENDHIRLSNMVRYPLKTSLHGKRTQIHNQKTFLKHFDEIFDKEVRCAILKTKEQEIAGNYRGFSTELSEVWFDDVLPAGDDSDSSSPGFWTKGRFQIITVNNGLAMKLCTDK